MRSPSDPRTPGSSRKHLPGPSLTNLCLFISVSLLLLFYHLVPVCYLSVCVGVAVNILIDVFFWTALNVVWSNLSWTLLVLCHCLQGREFFMMMRMKAWLLRVMVKSSNVNSRTGNHVTAPSTLFHVCA